MMMMMRRSARQQQQGLSLSSLKRGGSTRRRNVQVVVGTLLLVAACCVVFWLLTGNNDPLLGTFLTSSSSTTTIITSRNGLSIEEIMAAKASTFCRELVHPSAAKTAAYFSTVAYDDDNEQGDATRAVRRRQAHRDADLQPLSIQHIFDNDVPVDGKQTTHRWAGVHFNTTLILQFAQQVIAPWAAEWNAFATSQSRAKNPKLDYYRQNGMHEGSDPIILHSFVRTFRPQRVLEIGSGFSSRVTVGALARNEKEQSDAQQSANATSSSKNIQCPEPSFTVIDPSMARMARDESGKIVGPTDVHSSWVEQERLAFFTREYLKAGDLLFIDSSHALGQESTAGTFYTDVMVEYLEVLPRLPNGVFCHVHDISFPDHTWFYDRNWAEQFVLRAFLMYNPYFDVVWSGGALNMPWAHLEEDAQQIESADLQARVQATRQAAADAVGPYFYVFDVGKKRPFAGGGSIWIRRNQRPYPGAAAGDDYNSDQTLEQILKNPNRHLAGVADTPSSIKVQKDYLQFVNGVTSSSSSCLAKEGRLADCVVCALVADLPGSVHVFDLDRLSTTCSAKNIQHHSRMEMLTLPLSFFTSLKAGDTIVLSNAAQLGPERRSAPGMARDLATLMFIMEVAPRLATGVHVVLYDGLLRDVSGLVEQKQSNRVGAFLVQSWLTMNDALEVLWWQDSDIAQTLDWVKKHPDAPNDHAVIVKIL